MQLAANDRKGKAEDLAARFVRGVGAALPERELEAALLQVIERARSRWPGIRVSDLDFVEYLAERVQPLEDALARLADLYTSDLFLAFACLEGDVRAMAAFDRHYVENLRLSSKAAFAAELKQILRERLLVAQAGERPRLAQYGGRGPLAGWLRITAARLAANLRRNHRSELRCCADRDLPLALLDPELSYLKSKYRVEFEEAIEVAFRELSAREAALLKLHFFEELPVVNIARMYRVSPRTVQRWLAAAESKILDAVWRDLGTRLSLTDTELDSLLRLIISQLGVSVHRFLKLP